MTHVRVIAAAPRPLATQMNKQTRDYIVTTLRGMGLDPEIQTATVQKQTVDNMHNVHVTLAVVQNIVVRKPGTLPNHANKPAVLLATHYDSYRDTLGAADGAASPAAMIETLRALQAGAPLRNDTIFLFADGDKEGMLGEQAFVEQHPLARQVGLSLGFHHLGNRGPVVLLKAHGNAGDAISAWANSAAHPQGSSLIREAAKFMANTRGTSPLTAMDAPLLEFAAVEGKLGRFDTPDLLDQSTLQHEGDTMLTLARTFGARALTRSTGDAEEVYFSVPALGMLHYSADLVWPLTRLTCLLLAAVCCLAIQRAAVDPSDIVNGAFGYALIVGLPLGVFYLDGLYGWFAQLIGQPNGLRYVEGLALLMAAIVVLLQRRLVKRIGLVPAALGALAWLALMLAVVSWRAPGASFLLAWPLLAAALALAAMQLRRVQGLPPLAQACVMVAGLAPAVLLIVPAARDAFSLLMPFRLHMPLWFVAALLGFGLGLLPLLGRRYAVRACALAGLGLLAMPGAASAPEADPPRANPLIYYKHMPTWSEWWFSREPTQEDWSRALFPGQPRPQRLVDVLGWDSDEYWYARAKRLDGLAFPNALLLINDSPPKRAIEFDLASTNRAPNIELRLQGGKPWQASVNGRTLSSGDWQIRNWSLSLYGMENRKLHFRFELVGDPILIVAVEEHLPGVPEQLLPKPLPREAFIPMSGQTISFDTLWFR
jgi:hypothetical protein